MSWVRAQVMSCSRPAAPQRSTAATGRGGDDLNVASVVLVLARPPQVGVVRAGGLHPVGGHHDAVQVHMRQAGLGRGRQGLA
jgi:hypothetical protein